MKLPKKGHVYGLNTKKGIALLQLAEDPETPTSLQLMRVCDGFLNEPYNDEDISDVISKKELFFLYTPLRSIKRNGKVYKTFFAFDKPFQLPSEMDLPQFLRGYTVLNDGTVKWYKKSRTSNYREFVRDLTSDFLQLSPDNCWGLPDLRDFLENGLTISDYI